MVPCLRIIEANPVGIVNYHKGATLPISRVRWGGVEVQAVVEHTFTG